jgi:serine palmitoyltransferase
LVDEACSEPIMTGVNLSRSTVRYFRHNDLAHLESILEAIAAEDKKLKRDTLQQRRFIVVESVYRNVGDICPLKEMIALKEKFCYRMVLDETYAFGLLGKTGRGLTEHVGIETSQVEVITITMDTALSSVGGVCIGSREIVDHQRLSGAGYCFSASLAPFLCAGAVAALKKIQSEPVLISKFQSVAKKLTEVLSKVPKMVLLAKDTTGIVHLSLATKLSAVEESRVLKEITEKALQNGVAVTTSKYSVLHSKSLRPSIMVCANVNWTDETIKKIGDSITKAVNSTI